MFSCVFLIGAQAATRVRHLVRCLTPCSTPSLVPFRRVPSRCGMQPHLLCMAHGRMAFLYCSHRRHNGEIEARVGLGSIDSISTWFGISVSILLRSAGPQTHAGPSLLLRKGFGFDRFDDVSVSTEPSPFGDRSPAWKHQRCSRTSLRSAVSGCAAAPECRIRRPRGSRIAEYLLSTRQAPCIKKKQ